MNLCRLRNRNRLRPALKSTKRSAFGAILLGLTATGAAAQSSLPDLPPMPTQCVQSASLPKLESRVVHMLGLTSHFAQLETPTPRLKPVLPDETKACPSTWSKANSTANPVVLASATEETGDDSSSETIVPALPISHPVEEFESLIDIDIPVKQPTPPAATQLDLALPTEVPVPATSLQLPPAHIPETESSRPALVLPQTPANPIGGSKVESTTSERFRLTDSEPETSAASESTESTRAPQVVVRGKTMRLRTRPPATRPPAMPVVEAASEPTLDDGKAKVRLSESPDSSASAIVKRAGRMRVRIEGEPPKATTIGAVPLKPVHTKPTFEQQSKPATRARQSTVQPAPATLASSVTTIAKPVVQRPPGTVVAGESMSIEQRAAVSLTAETPILEFSVENPDICKLIRTSDSGLSVIGLQQGITRIAIVTAADKDKHQVEIRSVRVSEEASTGSNLQAVSHEISPMIARLYPSSQVEIVANNEQLIVQGLVDSETHARKILILVRKTTLQPVIDRLQVADR